MRRYNIILIVALAICLIPLYVNASSFYYSPEDFWDEWQTEFPYQRNIYLDFSSDPKGPPNKNGIPGADYEGWLDDALMESDFVNYDGDVTWDEGGQKIGVEGPGPGLGSGIIHIDNLDIINYAKKFWIEVHITTSATDTEQLMSWLNWTFNFGGAAEDYVLYWPLDDICIFSIDPTIGIATYGMILPNPEWEEIQFEFNVPEGNNYVWIHDVHLATECVPISSAVWFLGSGLICIVGIRRKIKK